jgi:ribosomal protein S27E
MTAHLDGNVLGGALGELFAVDLTTAMAECAGCGDRAAMAQAMVYADGPGMVARCAVCGQVIMRLVRGEDRAWVAMRGIRSLEVALPR